jgi:lipooligosaccharide transport system permease protein
VIGVLYSLLWHATFDATYGAYIRMSTNHLYEAYLFTPVGAGDIVAGEVMWSATRSVMSATAVLVAASIFGLVDSPLAVFALPAAFLIGVMFASIAMLMTATAKSIGSMNNFFTLFLLPMFYVGGVFFPLDRLPELLQRIAWVMPLTPAAALVRGLVTGNTTPMMALWTLELAAYTALAFWLASYFMRKRLIR